MKKIILILLMSCTLQLVFGWGNTGHRAIAEIAYDNLSRKAKKEICKILGDDYLPLYANWADEVKSDKDSLKIYGKMPHYANMAIGETYETSTKREGGDVYTIFMDQIAILENDNSPQDKRDIALKLIIHMVADMHQPMHCARLDDRGGNMIDVTWFGKPSNLHKVWDSELIDYYNLGYMELSRFASKGTRKDISKWLEATPIDWLNESKLIADQIYDNVGDGKFSYHYAYVYQSVVFERVEMAGMRLAEVLNSALD